MTSLRFDFVEESYAALKNMEAQLKVKDMAEIVGRSLRFFKSLMQIARKEGRLFIEYPDGSRSELEYLELIKFRD